MQDLAVCAVALFNTFIIGSMGIAEITAVGLAGQVYFLFSITVFGICSAASVYTGQFWGGGDIKSIHKTIGISLIGSFSAAIIFTLGALLLPRQIMSFYSPGKDIRVIEAGVKYLRIYGFSLFLSAVILPVNVALRCTGQLKIPMFTIICSLLLELSLNYILTLKLQMGVRGVALAAVIARSCELALSIFVIIRLRLPVLGKPGVYFSFDRQFAKNFLKICAPALLHEMSWAIGTSLYNVAYGYTGTDGQGAVQITTNILNLFNVAGLSVGAATSILLANTLGAGERDKAIEYSRKLVKAVFLVNGLLMIIFVTASPFIIDMFSVADIVKHSCKRLVYVMALGSLAKAFNYMILAGTLRSGGDIVFGLVLESLCVWLVGVPVGFLCARFLGLPIYWVVLLVYLEEFIKVFFALKRMLSNKWAKCLVGK